MRDISFVILGVAGAIAVYTLVKVIWRNAAWQDGGYVKEMPSDGVSDPLSPAKIMATDLSEGVVRDRLNRFFRNLGITGDANIRNGYVVETIKPGEIASIALSLRLRAGNLLGHSSRGNMIGTDLYYAVKSSNPVMGSPDREYRLADISLDDIVSLVVLAERVAEDRKRSRSLYKGMSDDEAEALVRSALRAEFKMETPDHHDIEVGRAVIAQVFRVKGAAA